MSSKAKQTPVVSSHAESSLSVQIDRLGIVNAILADYAVQVAPYKAEADELEAAILDRFAGTRPDQGAVDEGSEYRLMVGARSEKQEIDVEGRAKVYKWIGKEAYLTLAKLTFESLKSALTAAQYESVVSKERSGNRSVKVVVKAAPEPLRAQRVA
jgi:hypothetical protein